MSKNVLILATSGAGKTTLANTMNPEDTFFIQGTTRRLPWKGSAKQYTKFNLKDMTGNILLQKDINKMGANIKFIGDKLPHVKNIIFDDFNYLQTDEYLRRRGDKNYYDKYGDIAQAVNDAVVASTLLPNEVYVFFMMHTEVKPDGDIGPVTVGKMLDTLSKIEGRFDIVLYLERAASLSKGVAYNIYTGNKPGNVCKTPMGMFPPVMQGDLLNIKEKIEAYYSGE